MPRDGLDKGNAGVPAKVKFAPEKDAKYIYNREIAFIYGENKGKVIPAGTAIASNIELNEGMFRFNLEGWGEDVFSSYYGWAFILATEENLAKFAEYKRLRQLKEEAELFEDAAWGLIATLEKQP